MKKNIKMLVCALAVMGITTLGTPVSFVEGVVALNIIEASEAETRAYIYEWYYKVIDGHVYKRLYNATKGEWAGDWILVE